MELCNKKVYRIIDANMNRISEGLRVIEDICRFGFDAKDLQGELRSLRHSVRGLFAGRDNLLICARDSERDIGRVTSSQSTLDLKADYQSVILANFRRAEESFRVIEELFKAGAEYQLGKSVEEFRFQLYIIEKKIWLKFFCEDMNRRKLPKGLYGITAENFSNGRSNYDCVKQMLEAGVEIVQYREKYKSKREKFEEALQLRALTAEYGAVFIVNDDVDIAIAVGADGVHIGQDDMPASEVRRLVGDCMLIGLSTHSPQQAREACSLDIDYIGVGPIFSTKTKDNVCDPVGLEYLDYVVENLDIEYVAIGGIKLHNLDSVLDRGADRVCLVTEIVGADDIQGMVRDINEKINKDRGL
ncbi:MAG: thiamine phosphate synthase [Spirochaetales bacterium]|nr:thiamine phosphate synthase [Spirochaetales bacterium]